MSAVLIGEIMCFIKHDQIGKHRFAAAQRVEQLIAVDFSCADDQRRRGIFLAVASENANLLGPKLVSELLVL